MVATLHLLDVNYFRSLPTATRHEPTQEDSAKRSPYGKHVEHQPCRIAYHAAGGQWNERFCHVSRRRLEPRFRESTKEGNMVFCAVGCSASDKGGAVLGCTSLGGRNLAFSA